MCVYTEKRTLKIRYTPVLTLVEKKGIADCIFFVYLYFLGGGGSRGRRINIGGLICQKGKKKDLFWGRKKNPQNTSEKKLGHDVIQLGKQMAWEFW